MQSFLEEWDRMPPLECPLCGPAKCRYIGGSIVVLATYFSKTKNIFLSGIITTLPIITLLNMMLQIKYLNSQEFHLAQKSGILGAIGLVLFIASCYVLTTWVRPLYAILFAILILFLYFWMYKQLAG